MNPANPIDSSPLKLLAISPSGFVFDPRSGHTFSVNRTGLTVLSMLRDGASPERAAEALATEFDEPRTDLVLRDVEDFTAHLTRLQLTE